MAAIDKDEKDFISMLRREKEAQLRREEALRLAEEERQQRLKEAEEKARLKREREVYLLKKSKEKERASKELKRITAEEEAQRIRKEEEAQRCVIAKIDLSEQKMRIYRGEELLYQWKVSTARRGYVTPKGAYRPTWLTRMHYSKKYHNSPMPYSVFFKGGYAIHGTKAVWRLGRPASHGCVRLLTSNAKKFYELVRSSGRENTHIEIVE